MINVYSIKDVKVGYGDPFLQKNDAVALRFISNLVNDNENRGVLSTNPEDVELWKLGEYNEETGEIVPELRFVIKAIDLKRVIE